MDQLHIILLLLNIIWLTTLAICIYILKAKKDESDTELVHWRLKYLDVIHWSDDISNPFTSRNTKKMINYCKYLQKKQYGQRMISYDNDISAPLDSLVMSTGLNSLFD